MFAQDTVDCAGTGASAGTNSTIFFDHQRRWIGIKDNASNPDIHRA
jgi:hypothetical protein